VAVLTLRIDSLT